MKPKFFKTIESLRAWFTKHGATKSELWIGYYKKSSGKGGVVYKQALDEALCVGWIDGVVRSIDDACYMQRWTPRKPKSNWSNVNVKRIGELIAEGRVTPAGLAAFARRVPERTGVYTFEKPPQEFPPAFRKRFTANKAAWKFWSAQPPGYRRTITGFVMSAKQEATRERRLTRVIEHSARGERLA
ncbi:MAG: YdeI/OmpD-associated family protein [Gemmatimonadaceae bacterium]|nr:YdeI/OmpD-associated family protein [Gemmatimonadaceae bacterium]